MFSVSANPNNGRILGWLKVAQITPSRCILCKRKKGILHLEDEIDVVFLPASLSVRPPLG
jgi:hypothetical protein